MNIITADFNWISLLIIVVTVVIGIVKSKSKKQAPKSMFPLPDFEPYEEEKETEERSIYSEIHQSVEETSKTAELPGDYYTQDENSLKEESPIYATNEEETEEAHTYFDIRQAIISSEILKRPQF